MIIEYFKYIKFALFVWSQKISPQKNFTLFLLTDRKFYINAMFYLLSVELVIEVRPTVFCQYFKYKHYTFWKYIF